METASAARPRRGGDAARRAPGTADSSVVAGQWSTLPSFTFKPLAFAEIAHDTVPLMNFMSFLPPSLPPSFLLYLPISFFLQV